ncbi:MAG: nodulation protein NodD [Planctomycetaceae bacterium TMED241]|jgi:membrane protein implicated in regulation of membrane protease activity|nr:MAG: nodulation protein NodD [Planctomycetaceae bacterium TMED241]|tara:strand:+ start:142 stop:642 length:501 start_codon:yes stop_codon:yes gene_type:complete
MLLTYLFCLLAGGVLIALSLEGDSGADADGAGGNLSLLFSTPFWSFGLCGFGLCGLLLSLLTRSGTVLPTVVVALGMGVAMGLAAARLLGLMGRRDVNSLVRSADLIGREGIVTLAIEAESRGFVELTARGSLIRRPAVSNGGSLPQGTTVVVVASDGHTLRVDRI